MNKILIPIYQLYLLQLENYELFRYWNLLFQKGYFFSSTSLRKWIVWTKKALLLFSIGVFIYIGFGLLLIKINNFIAIIYYGIGYTIFPLFYSLGLIVLTPFDVLIKKYFIYKAHRLLQNNAAQVIALVGSYGKTTMKNVLYAGLHEGKNVIKTPESVNTPIGISRWLVKSLSKDIDIAIIEMGEHYEGDIKELCRYFPPNIVVVTGINEAHLERLGTIDKSIKTIFEAVRFAPSGTKILLNSDDKNIMNAYRLYCRNRDVSFYSKHGNSSSSIKIMNKKFSEEKLQWSVTFEEKLTLNIPLLGEYAIGDVEALLIVGKLVGISPTDMKRGIETMTAVPHRLEPINGNGGILVIDDSYNGNSEGVKEAIGLLSQFTKRRKVYITPGLVETGSNCEKVHRQIGKQLASVADVIMLVRNSVTPFIYQGLKEENFKEGNIKWFATAAEAHAALPSIVKPNDVVLFQNDWGDQYN